jgi:DNA-binding response OmpR family regulator
MSAEPDVLLVGVNRRNLELMQEILSSNGYSAVPVADLGGLEAWLDKGGVRAALIDLTGMDPAIWESCERMRAVGMPFIVLSSHVSVEGHHEGLSHGARDVMAKPLLMRELLAAVGGLLKDGGTA